MRCKLTMKGIYISCFLELLKGLKTQFEDWIKIAVEEKVAPLGKNYQGHLDDIWHPNYQGHLDDIWQTIKDALEEKVTALEIAYSGCTFSIHSSCKWKN